MVTNGLEGRNPQHHMIFQLQTLHLTLVTHCGLLFYGLYFDPASILNMTGVSECHLEHSIYPPEINIMII